MKEAKPKSFKQVFAKDVTAEVERVRTYHLNDDDRTEVEKDDVVEGQCRHAASSLNVSYIMFGVCRSSLRNDAGAFLE